ncbi:MAG: hypothetical protein BroJett038_24010 [Chloroflexota bacterium]|jgi:hypothetical protein|nr:MAG: hypothetical protein BroJett038_24010 [Chloroflexota bacterium]
MYGVIESGATAATKKKPARAVPPLAQGKATARVGAQISHPIQNMPAEFVDELDRIDPLTCSRKSLERLYHLAPTSEAKAFIVGILDTRRMMALVTGVSF